MLGQTRLRFFGNVRGMIIQDDANRAGRRVARVQVGQEADKLDTAMAALHAGRDVVVLQIERRQYGTRAQPLAWT